MKTEKSTRPEKRKAGNTTASGFSHERPTDRILARLEGVRASGPGRWMARCPAHDDRVPSLSVRECDDGLVLLHPFCGCDKESILSAIGLRFDDLRLHECRSGLTRGAQRRDPPFDWRGFRDATKTVLTALCLACIDIAEGRDLSHADRGWIAREASRLLEFLEVAR